MLKGVVSRALSLVCLLVFCSSGAYANDEIVEGRDYVLIDPVQTQSGERIEVVDFFFYGCNSCYRMFPDLQEWAQRQGDVIDFKRVPALRRDAWIPLGKLYFTLQSLGVLTKLHANVYYTIHVSGMRLNSRDEQVEWAVAQGLEKGQFEATMDSDDVLIATQIARDATIAYGVRFTPSIVIDGRFLTTGEMIGSASRLNPLLDQLIELALKSR